MSIEDDVLSVVPCFLPTLPLLRLGQGFQEGSDYLFQFHIRLLRDLAFLSDSVQQGLVGRTEML